MDSALELFSFLQQFTYYSYPYNTGIKAILFRYMACAQSVYVTGEMDLLGETDPPRQNGSVRRNGSAKAKWIRRPPDPFRLDWAGKSDSELFSKLSICLTSYLSNTDIGNAWFKDIF